ncbi:MAG: hypothetical protein HYX84_01690 [Chloroflexi bacterium]|nr:hypothetical protein [Chloroflexota bacterium]
MAQLDQIMDGLHRISTLVDPPGITFNQFVIKDEKTMLVHTGAASLFPRVVENMRQVVDVSALSYVFISHFEADECGSLAFLLALNHNIIPVAPGPTARHLAGFGIHSKPMTVKEGDELVLGRRRLQFINYPSEPHLQDGLIAYDTTDKVLFSSDLFTRRGEGAAVVVKGVRSVFSEIPPQAIPVEDRRLKCQEAIKKLDIALIATGHGPVIDLRA